MSLTCGNDRNDESSSAMRKSPTPPKPLAHSWIVERKVPMIKTSPPEEATGKE